MKHPPQKSIRYFYYFFFWITAVCLDSCETPEETHHGITHPRRWFEQNLSTGWDAWPKGSTVQSIEWQNAITTGFLVEVPVRLQGKISAHMYDGTGAEIAGVSTVRLVLWPKDDGYEAAVLQFVLHNGQIPRSLTEMEASDFSGLVLANRGGGQKKRAALYEKGKLQRQSDVPAARTQTWVCNTICERVTITVGGYSGTQFYCDDSCYEDEWQIPMPPEGGGGDGFFIFPLGTVSGGNSSGGWSNGFPPNPNHGDIFEVRDPSGLVFVYIWNSFTNTWEILYGNIPEVLVTAQSYEFLYGIPTDFIITGPDNFVYKFNETLQAWVSRPAIIDPCILAKFWKNNEAFKNKMQDLQSNTNLNYERGYLMVRNPDGTYSYSYIQGQPGVPEIAFDPQSLLSGYIHSHYTGTFSTFSAQDVKAIYDLFINNSTLNLGQFTVGLVSSQGTSYLMLIENLSDFLSFAQVNFSSETAFNDLEDIYNTWYLVYRNQYPQDEITARELALLKTLAGSGLAIFKGNSTFDNWSKVENQNNEIVMTNCN
jgi:hypothetical protein